MTMTDPAAPAPSLYLTGTVFKPVHDELDVPDLRVSGRLPERLSGAYLRNGSNPQFPPLGAYHWFDGDGMVHGVYLEGGRARYRNRWVDTPGLEHERKVGHALFGGLMNIVFPPDEIFAECGIFKNAANTNVIRHAGKVLALWEGGNPTELTWNLDTVGAWDYRGKLVGAMTAHPKWDDRTGELIFFGYGGSERPFLRHHVVDRNGVLVRSLDIDIPRGVMMHDFLTTANYSLFFDMPAVIEPAAMMAGEKMWQPDLGCRIGVLPRHATSDTTRWFEIDPMYVFHFLNAWEEPGTNRIVAIGCRMPSVDLNFDSADSGEVRSRKGIGLHRWVIDLDAGTVTEEQLSDTMSDFPRVNDSLVGYESRFGHVSTKLGSNPAGVFDALAQFDLVSGASTVKHFGNNSSLGEAVFAADPDGRDERDGWVMVYVTDVTSGDTDLVVLDGHDITEEVARVHMPRRVPVGFHGNWLPQG